MEPSHGLSQRHQRPEVMDDPGLDRRRHHAALRGLARINRLSRSAAILWPPLAALADENRERPVRVLDLACGGGDVTLALWRKARRSGVTLELVGCDISPTALEFASRHARDAGAGADLRFAQADLLRDPLPDGFDALVCSLFLHHLDDDQAVALLRKAGHATNRLVLVNDLVRSRWGLGLAWVGTRLLTTSAVVHSDGPRSVRAAFTIAEAAALAERAGLRGATVSPRWPCRFLLAWDRRAAPTPIGAL